MATGNNVITYFNATSSHYKSSVFSIKHIIPKASKSLVSKCKHLAFVITLQSVYHRDYYHT